MRPDNKWLSVVIPVSALSSGLSVLIPLMILSSKGNVFNVGFVITLYTLVGIPASLFWGRLTDKLRNIRLFVLFSIISIFPELIILYFISNYKVIIISYALYSFLATAASPSLNILVIGRRRNSSLSSYFSLYSIFIIIGGIFGMLPGLLIDSKYLYLYLLFLIFVNFISFILAFRFIRPEFNKLMENRRIVHINRSFSILNMLTTTQFLITSHRLIHKLSFIIENRKSRMIYEFLLVISIFELGIYLFNTSYIPFLYHYSLDYSQIFLINIFNLIGQTIVYLILIKYRRSVIGFYYRLATLLRGSSYFIAFLPVLFLPSILFQINLIAYFIAGFSYALWNVASSVILYSFIRGKHAANYLGIWTAALGFSGVIGAFLSGIISLYLGYELTFIVSIIITLMSSFMFSEKRFHVL